MKASKITRKFFLAGIGIGMGVAAIVTSATAFAQSGDAKSSVAQMERAMQQTAARLGSARLNPAEAKAPYQGKVTVDPSKDAWRPVTSEAMRQATSQDAWLTKPRFSVTASVDFDGDGHIDTAQMVNNSRQGAVFVTFGGPNRRAPALAFKIDRPFTGGEEIRAAGRNRILLTIPDVSEQLLFMDHSGPKVIKFGE